jgi:formamidopyrimidine-DNA glycosylase
MLVAELSPAAQRRLLTQDQVIPAWAIYRQDILFLAKLHPRHPIDRLQSSQVGDLYRTICATVSDITAHGGRYDEVDLYGHPGGYIRLMDKNSAGKPCPVCGTIIEKMQYLGERATSPELPEIKWNEAHSTGSCLVEMDILSACSLLR